MRHLCKISSDFRCYMIVAAVLLAVIHAGYYYTERTVPFEYVTRIPKFDGCHPQGFDYANTGERVYYYLVDYYKNPARQKKGLAGCDSVLVSRLIQDLDFERYDYVITYMQKMTKLKHSPYLTNNFDDLYFDKRTPLIAEYDGLTYDSLYVYRIRKNSNFRAPVA